MSTKTVIVSVIVLLVLNVDTQLTVEDNEASCECDEICSRSRQNDATHHHSGTATDQKSTGRSEAHQRRVERHEERPCCFERRTTQSHQQREYVFVGWRDEAAERWINGSEVSFSNDPAAAGHRRLEQVNIGRRCETAQAATHERDICMISVISHADTEV